MKVEKSVRPQGGCAGARNIHCLLARIVLAIGLTASVSGPSEAATCYASPGGSGNGQSEETPFCMADFWERAKGGDTLLLLDGVYRGSASMIAPPQGLKGESGKPITVRAMRDGGAVIDGENARRPVKLYGNDWFILEGFNAHSAHGADYYVDVESRGGQCDDAGPGTVERPWRTLGRAVKANFLQK